MATTVNLDRAIEMNITYPLGVDETITITYDDEVTLTDTYQIVIADNSDTIIETITEADAALTKSTNQLIWNINYEDGGLLSANLNYQYEIQNTTGDYRDFKGTISVTKTIQ